MRTSQEQTINTIEVMDKDLFPTLEEVITDFESELRDLGIRDARVASSQIYSIVGEIEDEDVDEATSLVHHELTQKAIVNGKISDEKRWNFTIRVDFKPGVTDNAARVLKEDLGLMGINGCDVYTSKAYYIQGQYRAELEEMLSRVASNPQIHNITILTRDQFNSQGGWDKTINPVILPFRHNYYDVDIGSMDDDELKKTGYLGTLDKGIEIPKGKDPDDFRDGGLALKLDYMHAAKDYTFSDKHLKWGRRKGVLTNVEMEVLGQMWSEHCRHSLFNATIPGNDTGVFDIFIKKPSMNVLEKKPHLGVSVYKDNAGVFEFDENWNLAVKIETHNSPSALDPYGGAITGIVGVNRDPKGTGLSSELIGNMLFYFFGHPEDTRRYYKTKNKDGTLENLLLNPKQIKRGVNLGVEHGGNQMGIPINIGDVTYHDRYYGKPIVGVGSIGILPKTINGQPSEDKHIDLGDRLYVLGGRAGCDGIHGATFSSEGLSSNSPATAVQIGDPYTQKKMFDAITELRDKGYIKYITDLGAGGISCAGLEMAEETGGVMMDLDRLLKKYPNMTASEILLNESQERMALAVDKDNKDEIEAILRKHQVEFSDIGVFTGTRRAEIFANGDKVVDLDMDFIHHGYPQRSLEPTEYKLSVEEIKELERNLQEVLDDWKDERGLARNVAREEFWNMLRRPNLESMAPLMDRMDSTVGGYGLQHCIQGRGRVSTRSSVTLPVIDSEAGLVIAYGHTERQSNIDSEKMGKNAMLRSIGNNIAIGGKLDHMVALDEFLWQSSDEGKYQQMLIEASRGMADVIEGSEVPVISGKDSMYNQAKIYDEEGNVVQRGVWPTLFMLTAAKMDDVSKIVTIDAKKEGDIVYVVGATTKADMGGSEYLNMLGEANDIEYNIGQVSDEDITDVMDTYKKMNTAVDAGMLQSSMYVEAGGLMTAIAHSAMAGNIGMEISMDNVHCEEGLNGYEIMYGETEGRFLVSVSSEQREEFERLMGKKASCIGVVKGDSLIVRDKQVIEVISENVEDMLNVYHKRYQNREGSEEQEARS